MISIRAKYNGVFLGGIPLLMQCRYLDRPMARGKRADRPSARCTWRPILLASARMSPPHRFHRPAMRDVMMTVSTACAGKGARRPMVWQPTCRPAAVALSTSALSKSIAMAGGMTGGMSLPAPSTATLSCAEIHRAALASSADTFVSRARSCHASSSL